MTAATSMSGARSVKLRVLTASGFEGTMVRDSSHNSHSRISMTPPLARYAAASSSLSKRGYSTSGMKPTLTARSTPA